MKTTQHLLRAGLAAALVLAITSCRTIQYREVQSDFERAVEAETARTESPFVDWYRGVSDTLTDDFISGLDEKLRPNAWMLRGMSEWRSGSYSNANISAGRGSTEIERLSKKAPDIASSRDAIVLTMLPGLVTDSQLRDKLRSDVPTGTNFLSGARYTTGYLRQFESVITQFDQAEKKFAAPTPASVRFYWNFQIWRALENWSFTMGKLVPGDDAATNAVPEADQYVAGHISSLAGATNIPTAMKAAESAIPTNHPYRKLMEFERRR